LRTLRVKFSLFLSYKIKEKRGSTLKFSYIKKEN